MSLVVGHLVEGDIRIVCDTHYRKEGALHEHLFDGALKAIIVSPSRCICFAGSGEAARVALRPVLDHPDMSRDELLRHLREQHLHFQRDVDFIIACTNVAPTLARIAAGTVEDDLQVAWIGDHAAFENYQAHYLELKAEPPFAEFPDTSASDRNGVWMIRAMKRVIENPAHPSVKGFLLRVTSQPAERDGFRYLASASGSGFHPVVASTTPQSIVRPLGAEAGGYRDNIFVPKMAGVGAVGIYVNEARSGLLLYPARGWSPIKFRSDSVVEFWDSVRERYGIEIWGMYWGG